MLRNVRARFKEVNAGFLLVAVLFMFGCNYYEGTHEELGENELRRKGEIGFEELKAQVFTPHCVRCHSQYSEYEGAQREAVAIDSAIHADRMPKDTGALPKELKSLVRLWVSEGAPEKPGQDGSKPIPVELEPTWNSISKNIFVPNCQACHNPNGQAKFLDLTRRAGLLTSRNQVLNFSEPEKSLLIEVLLDDEEPMPPKDSNLRRLTQGEVQVIQNWIKLGIP